MAHIQLPALESENLHGSLEEEGRPFLVPAVQAINGVPTVDQVRLEATRWYRIVNIDNRYPGIPSDDFYSAGLQRFNTVMNGAFNNNSRENRLMLANISVQNARALNARLDHHRQVNENFAVLVKYKEGHPAVPTPVVINNVQINNEYRPNDDPPANLIPANYFELLRIQHGDPVAAARRFNAIRWFYNDVALVEVLMDTNLPEPVAQDDLIRATIALDTFLRYPSR